MTDTILLKGFSAPEQLSGLLAGEFAIDTAQARFGFTSGPVRLDIQPLPEPVSDSSLVYQWDGTKIVLAPLRAGGGARPVSGGSWRAPGLRADQVVNPLISTTYEADIDVTKPGRVTGIATLPEFSGGFTFGIRPKGGFSGSSGFGDLAFGTHIRNADLPIRQGRYTVFITPQTPIRFKALKGALTHGPALTVPVFLRIEESL